MPAAQNFDVMLCPLPETPESRCFVPCPRESSVPCMHEVSVALALLELVREQAAAVQANRVTRLVLEIGALSHVDPHALRFAVEVAAQGGLAEGAELVILQPQGHGYCLDCEAPVPLAAQGASCPQCGGVNLLARGGGEMRLKEMEVT